MFRPFENKFPEVVLRWRVDTETLKQHVLDADVTVDAAERRVARQRSLIRELTRDGHDIDAAAALLSVMVKTLALQQAHRRWLRRELASYR